MRGAPIEQHHPSRRHGIIPADAGSTACAKTKPPTGEDHPRGCGEHCAPGGAWLCAGGSSPRMRGAQNDDYGLNYLDRIIPADAGSTRLQNSGMNANMDHPRGCGEHDRDRIPRATGEGSSPRMRGAPVVCLTHLAICGIIPADAGSTGCLRRCRRRSRDHPRGCGEHTTRRILTILDVGSSPRMRGAHHAQIDITVPAGIIPAGAGSTVKQSLWCSCSQDHPRGCGEHR